MVFSCLPWIRIQIIPKNYGLSEDVLILLKPLVRRMLFSVFMQLYRNHVFCSFGMYFHFTWKYSVLYFLFIPFIFVMVALDLILEDFQTLNFFSGKKNKNEIFLLALKNWKKLYFVFFIENKTIQWFKTQIHGK